MAPSKEFGIKQLHISNMPSSPAPMEQSRSLDIGIPGIKQILNQDTRLWKKLIWFALLTACIAAVIYQLTDRISYYLSEPTNMHIVVKENYSIIFPSLNICPSLFTSVFLATITSVYLSANQNNLTRTDKWCPNESLIIENTLLDEDSIPINMKKFWQLLAMNKSGITVTMSQSFLGAAYDNSTPLAIQVKETEVPWTKCLTVNLVDPIRIYGETSIIFTIPIFKLFTILNKFWNCPVDFYRPEFLELGFATNDFGIPLPHGYDVYEFVRVFPGQKAIYRLGIRQLFNVHTTKTPCEKDWVHSYLAYEECIRKRVRALNFSCSVPFTKFTEARLCDTRKSVAETALRVSFYLLQENDYKEECRQMQTRLCYEKKFTPEYKSSTNFSDNHTLQIKFLIHDQFFEAVHEEYTYLLPSLISDIGGSLGIFLGICVLTVVEILDTIFVELQLRLQNCGIKK